MFLINLSFVFSILLTPLYPTKTGFLIILWNMIPFAKKKFLFFSKTLTSYPSNAIVSRFSLKFPPPPAGCPAAGGGLSYLYGLFPQPGDPGEHQELQGGTVPGEFSDVGTSGQIELHITSVVTDWQENVYVRKAWFMGHKVGWKEVIRRFLLQHLDDLSTGIQLIKMKLRNFEVDKGKFVPWEKYGAENYGIYE